MRLADTIRTIPDYPKKGILFRDITTLLGDAKAFRRAVDELVQPWAGTKIDKVAGVEARGFILGGAVAHQLSAGFVPIRKKGKLPHATVSIPYSLEYGLDHMEMHEDAVTQGERVILVDDLIATGGTAEGAIKLLSADGRRGRRRLFRHRPSGPWRRGQARSPRRPSAEPGLVLRPLRGGAQGWAGAGISHISERTRKRRSRPLSRENMPPRPGTTSMTRSVCFQASYCGPLM